MIPPQIRSCQAKGKRTTKSKANYWIKSTLVWKCPSFQILTSYFFFNRPTVDMLVFLDHCSAVEPKWSWIWDHLVLVNYLELFSPITCNVPPHYYTPTSTFWLLFWCDFFFLIRSLNPSSSRSKLSYPWLKINKKKQGKMQKESRIGHKRFHRKAFCSFGLFSAFMEQNQICAETASFSSLMLTWSRHHGCGILTGITSEWAVSRR